MPGNLTPQESYSAITATTQDRTLRAGRYGSQREAERLILGDILPKLQPEPHHRVLDIGCGSGLLLVPLAQMVEEIVGIDHPDIIKALADTLSLANVTLVAGAFPDAGITGLFDRIVAYSVLQYNPHFDAALAFVRAAAGLLREGGRLLIGDMPNPDRRARFRASARGEAFDAEWARMRALRPASQEEAQAFATLARSSQLGELTDVQICRMAETLRTEGFDVWLMPQRPDLPFGNTREDMIVVRP